MSTDRRFSRVRTTSSSVRSTSSSTARSCTPGRASRTRPIFRRRFPSTISASGERSEGELQVAAAPPAGRSLLLPSGRPRHLRRPAAVRQGRPRADGPPARTRQHRPFPHDRARDVPGRLSRRQVQPEADHHVLADFLVACDDGPRLRRNVHDGPASPVGGDRRRRKLLRSGGDVAPRVLSQGDAFARVFDPPGRPVSRTHAERRPRLLGARARGVLAEILYNHFSNGSLAQPNGGLNLFDGHIGLKYMPVYKEAPQQAVVTKPTKRWYGEFIVSGGAKKLYYKDTQYFGCASINIGGYYRTCNQHRIGIGVDLFYDGAYVPTAKFDPNTSTYVDDNTYTSFGRTFITENKIENKLRCGINIANDLIIGKFLIGFQAGIYLYDPIKNYEPYDDAKEGKVNKGLIYGYNIQKEDGWNYFRISAKYYITKHLLANISIKTHLQKVEFVEFGIGVGFS